MAKKAEKANAPDAKTLELIKEVKRRKDEISKAEKKPAWRTNGHFSYGEGLQGSSNIQVLQNVQELILIVAFLKNKAAAYLETAAELEVDSPPDFKWQGFSLQDWTEDIKTRIGKIQVAAKKKKFEELEARLDKIISPELRRELELQAVLDELG